MADPTPGQAPAQSPDFQLRPVQTPAAGGAAPAAASPGSGAAAAAPSTASSTGIADNAAPGSAGMTPTELVSSVAIVIVLGLLFLLVRGAVRGHLIGERASLSAASNAGWAMWAFLCSVTVTAVFGIVGGLLDSVLFAGPMLVLVLATLFLAVATWRGALRRRR